MKYLQTDVSTKQCSDAGMAASLILLLVGVFSDRILFYQLAVPALVINMAFPRFYYPFAILWFGLSGLMGDIVSRILLTIVYLVLVVPVGFIRKLAGKDSMNLKVFRKSDSSVMIKRDHIYSPADLEKPF
jgi:uncharacterized membrane protein